MAEWGRRGDRLTGEERTHCLCASDTLGPRRGKKRPCRHTQKELARLAPGPRYNGGCSPPGSSAPSPLAV